MIGSITAAVIAAIRQTPPVSTVGQIAYRAGIGAINAQRAVNELLKSGEIVRSATGIYQINDDLNS